jgi:hypothetical protein
MIDCEVGIAYGAACLGLMEQLPTPYRILMTMFEADKWPIHWLDACNVANQVWVPSRFCQKTLMESGCQSPVEIVPLGIDPEVYYPPKPTLVLNSSVFRFGYTGAATLRKGFDLLVRAFLEEFAEDEPVRLEIRSSNMLPATAPEDKRIDVKIGEFSTFRLRNWYQALDCFVMPTRGEGFGLTALEAMACGKCAIVTAWGGCTDYLGDYSLGVAIDGTEPCPDYQECGGRWAKPSLSSLRYCMRYAFEHREKIWEMGRAAAEVVRDKWDYKLTAKRIESILSKVKPHERVELDSVDMVVWRGRHRIVTNRAGRFVRGIPVELPPEKAALLDFSGGRFCRERRYRRSSVNVEPREARERRIQ